MSLPEAIRVRLEETVGEVFFSDIAAHLERDAVFIVATGISLVACGVAVATDDVEQVGTWLAGGALRKPSQAERDAWPSAPGLTFRAIVVKPFVLVEAPTRTFASPYPSA